MRMIHKRPGNSSPSNKYKIVTCPECHGEGGYREYGYNLHEEGVPYDCDLCKGEGKIPLWLKMEWLRSQRTNKKEGGKEEK